MFYAESAMVYTINLYHFSTVITVLKAYTGILRQIKSDIETVFMYSSDEEFLFYLW